MGNDDELTPEVLEAQLDQDNPDQLQRWAGRNRVAIVNRIDSWITHFPAKAFLLWARMRTSDSGTLREVSADATGRFDTEHLPRLQGVWMKAPAEAREVFIREVFERDPGEPFTSIRHSHHVRGVGLLPPIGYVPSYKVHVLRRLVRTAGDQQGLKLIDKLIKERRRACEIGARAAAQLRERYRFRTEERELVAPLLTLARRAGFRAAALPEVTVSYESPPIFVTNPELEDVEERGSQEREVPKEPEGKIPRDPQRPLPKAFPIEELLGCYRPRSEDVVLWCRGIDWAAQRFGISHDWLSSAVLIHELLHWLAHKLPAPGALEWPLDSYIATTEEVHECWAQLMVWFVAESVGGEFKTAFEGLNSRQPASYRIWERFRTVHPSRAFAALVHLRRLREPAELRDWEAVVT